MVFSPDSKHLATDQRQIALSSSIFDSNYNQIKMFLLVFVESQWIDLAEQRFLWLSSEYQSTCTAVRENIICIEYALDYIILLKFSLRNILRYTSLVEAVLVQLC